MHYAALYRIILYVSLYIRTQYREKECVALCLFIWSVRPSQIYIRVHIRLWHYMCVCVFSQHCAESVLCEIGSRRWNLVFAGERSLHTQTLTVTDFMPFLISACLHPSLVAKCRSSDLQGGMCCTRPCRFFLCLCVFSVWFKYVSCCVPYGQNYSSQGTWLQAGNRLFELAC